MNADGDGFTQIESMQINCFCVNLHPFFDEFVSYA